MFASFYQLQEQPFGVNPDPRYLYLSKTHREVFSSLLYRVLTDCGFLAMIAQPGMGKTTLLFHLLNRLQATARTAFVFQTQCNSNDLVRYLLSEFGCTSNTTDPVRMFQALKAILVAEANEGRRCVVIIDEAQNLRAEVLETIRLLSDFETPRRKLLQIILSGQLELEEKLADPGLLQLRQRMSSIAHLQQFGTEDIVLYIAHRLKTAGYPGPVSSLFDGPALARIVTLSGGIPRVINNVCFNALSLGYAIGATRIDSSIIEEVACDLGINELFRPSSALLSEVESLLSAEPVEDIEADDSPIEEVYAAVAAEAAAAERASVEASAAFPVDMSPDEELEPHITTGVGRVEPATAAFAQAPASSPEGGESLNGETPERGAEDPAEPLQVATNLRPLRTRMQLRRSLDRSAPHRSAAIRGMGIAAALALLLGIGALLYVEHRATAKPVEAKSAVATHTESAPAASAVSLTLRPVSHESIKPDVVPSPSAPSSRSMRVRSASNEARPPVVQAEESEGTTLVLLKSKLPDDLPTQAVMPATSSVEIGAESADTDSASHAPALPMLRSAPLPKTLAPAVRNTGSLDAKYIPPRAIVRTSPAYPEFAKSSHVEGDVMLLVSISSTGKVRNAKALRGNTLLAAAAENAALGWRYAPGRRNGVAVDSQMQVLVRYRLQ